MSTPLTLDVTTVRDAMAARGVPIADVKNPVPHVAHVLTGDGRVFVVDGSVPSHLRVFAPDEYDHVDLAQVRFPELLLKWDVAASFPTAARSAAA